MDKDFWKKPISLKDINLKNISLKDLKNIKNKKEIVIGILVLVYIIVIICVGNSLLTARSEAKDEYDRKNTKCSSIKSLGAEEVLKEKLNELEVEREILADKFKAIESNNEFNDIFNDFKKNSPITLTDELVTITDIKNDMGEYEVYIVNIGSFSGNMEQIEEFLKYAEKYPKMVRVDNISFRKHEITGNISGSLKLSFYFKKLVEE